MWKNHLKIAFRSLGKNKLFTGLNIFGLAMGLCIASLLLLYIQEELSFDQHYAQKDQIHRILINATYEGQTRTLGNAPNAVGPAVKEEIAGVKDFARIIKHNYGERAFVNVENRKFVENDLYWGDASLLDFFDFNFIYGSKIEALKAPNQIILSESAAQKYFSNANPVGEALSVDNRYVMTVVGVYENLPSNASLDAAAIGSFSTVSWMQRLTWDNSSYETFLLLEENVQPTQIEDAMADLLDEKVPERSQWFTLTLQALGDIHLYSTDIENGYSSQLGDPQQLRLLSFLVLIILLIAAINYMNMSTARSQKKAKEVGINKTVGATRGQLMRQFYTETGVLVAFAFLLSFLLILISLPLFNRLADKNFSFLNFLQPSFLVGSLGVAFLITLISGAYPALYLSKFSPKSLFHNLNISSAQGNAAWFRKGLVISQFVASVIIIIATLVFFKQLQFTQNKNLGYQPELVIGVLTAGAENASQANGFINNLKRLPEVEQVGRVQTFPGNDGSGRSLAKPNDSEQTLMIQTNRASAEVVDLLSLNLLAGKSLPNRSVEKGDSIIQVILNKTAVEFLGYTPEKAIGREAPELFYNKRPEIVGVVEDFHFESFHKPIGAYAFHNNPSEWLPYTLVKLNTSDLASSMQKVKSTFEQAIPNSAFEYTFIDQHLETLYRTEQKVARIFLVFAILTILIACLGLFGLTAYTAERRKKEIGIRKVLGASILNITQLLSIDFLKLVLFAFAIATPIAWYLMRKWLQDFAYHIELQWWMFMLAGGVASIIALLTMSAQSVKAALTNPIESLRSE